MSRIKFSVRTLRAFAWRCAFAYMALQMQLSARHELDGGAL